MSQNWHTQRTQEIASMRHRLYAKTDSGHAFQMNESVQLKGRLVNGDQMLPPYITGRITAVNENDVTIAFDGYGDATLSHAIAADYLQPYQSKTATDAMRSVFHKGPRAVTELKAGLRVKDGRGAEYVVESFDPFRRMAVVSDGQGHVVTKAAGELKVLKEEGERQTIGSDGVQPGQKAMVTGIDANLNQWRKYAVQQGEAGGIVGQTGTIISAHYPTGAAGPGEGQGETMYTVLLPSGAKKSFSAKELRIVESEAASGLTEAREPVARRSLQPASAQRRPLVELTEDMLDALEEGVTHTRQHYELIGDILNRAKEHGLPADDHHTLVDAFGRMFRDDNPNYIHHRFVARANGSDYTGPRSRNSARPTQRHFQAAADVIRNAHISAESRNHVITAFENTFGDMNPRFKGHLFRKAAGSVTLPEKVGDVSRLGESVGGVQQGSIVHQPKPVTDPAPKPVPAATAAVPKTTTPKLGAVVKTPKGKGVVMGEVDGKLQVALDDGGVTLIDESVLLPAFGRPQWTPPEIPQEKDTPPLRLGDLIDYNGIPGVVAEIAADGAHVMLDNGTEVVVEMTPTATGVTTMVKPTAKPTTTTTPNAAPSASPVTTEADKDDKKGGEEDDDDEDEKDGEKKGDKDDDKEPDNDADDKKVTEGVIGMGTMPAFKTSAPSMHRAVAEGQPVEGSTLLIDGKEAQILGFTRFDGRTLLPTEARVSIGGEEQLVALGEGTKVVQERLNPVSAGIRRTLQRLGKERPQPIVKESAESGTGHKPPAFMRSLVESVRTGKGLRGGSSRVASPETIALEAQLNEHLTKA